MLVDPKDADFADPADGAAVEVFGIAPRARGEMEALRVERIRSVHECGMRPHSTLAVRAAAREADGSRQARTRRQVSRLRFKVKL